MWALDHKESWVLKNWCFWTVVLEKTLESPLDCKEIKPIKPKGNQYWIFIGKTDVEVETSILWPADEKRWLIGKDPDAGEDWRQEEKGMTEDEMVGWVVSPTQWTWVWASSKRWWRTGKTGMLQSMGLQRVRTERLNNWEGKECRDKGGQSGNNSVAIKQSPSFSWRYIITIWHIHLCSSTETKAPTQAEDYNYLLRPRLVWTSKLIIEIPETPPLLPHHQPIRGESYILQPSPQKLPLKTLPWRPSGSLGFLSMSHPFSLVSSSQQITQHWLQKLGTNAGYKCNSQHKCLSWNMTKSKPSQKGSDTPKLRRLAMLSLIYRCFVLVSA